MAPILGGLVASLTYWANGCGFLLVLQSYMIYREADVFAAIPQNPWLVSAPWLSLETMGLGEY